MADIKKLKIEPFATEDRIVEYAVYALEAKINEIIEAINEITKALKI